MDMNVLMWEVWVGGLSHRHRAVCSLYDRSSTTAIVGLD